MKMKQASFDLESFDDQEIAEEESFNIFSLPLKKLPSAVNEIVADIETPNKRRL